jgi:predicted RNA-binding protein with PUA domain
MKGQLKKQKRLERQLELLKNFNQEEDHYEEKKIGNQWYVKSFNGGTKRWQVSIFEEGAFGNYKAFSHARKEDEELDEKFKEKINFERPTLENLSNKFKVR